VVKSATKLSKNDTLIAEAKLYLADKAFVALLGSPPDKLRSVMKRLDLAGSGMRLLRQVMSESDRFECIDRRWTVSPRFGEAGRPFEKVLAHILELAGRPLNLGTLAGEVSMITGRPAEVLEETLSKFLDASEKFFRTTTGEYGTTAWLLDSSAEDEDDLLFENSITQEDIAPLEALASGLGWDGPKSTESAAEVVSKSKTPVCTKLLSVVAWRELGEDFDPIDFFSALVDSENLMLLSDLALRPASIAKDYDAALAELAEEIAAQPMEPDEDESEGPVLVSDSDKEEIISTILRRGSASAEELLDAVLEVGPGESAYAGALESLKTALEGDERIMWVGGLRWSKNIEFPEEIKAVPTSLVVPQSVPFETPEGDIFDQELEEDGFDGDLKAAIYDPLAEDVTDEDVAHTLFQENGDSQRCVLAYHHKLEGTFPLCQISPDFFGTEPEILPITVLDEGKRKEAYVNNSTRLIYGLKDLYAQINEISGAVFHLERTEKPGEFRFRYDGEVDDQLGIDTGRSLELLDLKGRFESQEMPIYDVLTEILQKQGSTFPRLVTEVNIVKRCSRLLIASLLSSYHCFTTRGKSGVWQYDEKKQSQGFNKTKRKYIKKA
jgi:hypothetical protein